MEGYGRSTYGDAFADVYDDWYDGISDIDVTVSFVTTVSAAAGRVLELGVGTGRLAVPLAAAGFAVVGIDASAAMLENLAARDPDGRIEQIHGDMVDDLPPGPFDVVLVAYNTLFSIETAERQHRLFAGVAERLAPGGSFIVEAFVPDVTRRGSSLDVRSLAADRVVLSASVHHPGEQRAEGQFIEITEAGGVRLRPWSIRYAPPAELDEMATVAGLRLAERFEDVGRQEFTVDSDRHVSVYRKL